MVASDRGDSANSATSTVIVNVVDANDNPPVFAQKRYRASVNEGSIPGTSVISLLISDLDTEAATQVEFFITSGDPGGHFQVGKTYNVDIERHHQKLYLIQVLTMEKYL